LSLLEGENASCVALIKPQFEAAREEVGEKGVVRSREVHEKVLRDITQFVPELGWQVSGLDYSPIRGPEGNIEFLLYLVRSGNMPKIDIDNSVVITICHAYDNFFKFSKGDL